MFTVERLHQTSNVLYENDEIKLVVGEISRGRSGWEFHHLHISRFLTHEAKGQLTVFGRQQAELRQITDRLLK